MNVHATASSALRVFRTRLNGRVKLFLFILLLVVTGVYVELDSLTQLRSPAWLICVDRSKRNTSNGGGCGRLRLNFLPASPEPTHISGKYAEDMETLREPATFSILPRFGQLTESTKGCHVKSSDVKWTLVNLIKSSIGNTARRKAIRSTWGAVKIINGLKIVNVFVVGKTVDVRMQASLKHESDFHGDILQFDKEDSARTVPEKVLAGMQWSSASLKSDTLYSSMDDDIVVHIPNLAKYLKNKLFEPQTCDVPQNTAEPQRDRPCLEDLPLLCVYSYQARDTPTRFWFSKWYISYSDFPGRQWPAYCRGGLYIAPVKMVDALFRVSRRTEHLYLDDVWITGFMRRKLGMGGSNIVPAPHSVRHDLFFQGRSDSYSDVILQHLWGDMKDGADIPQQVGQLWLKWKVDLVLENACTSPAASD